MGNFFSCATIAFSERSVLHRQNVSTLRLFVRGRERARKGGGTVHGGFLLGEPDGNRPPARPTLTFQNDTKRDLKKKKIGSGEPD